MLARTGEKHDWTLDANASLTLRRKGEGLRCVIADDQWAVVPAACSRYYFSWKSIGSCSGQGDVISHWTNCFNEERDHVQSWCESLPRPPPRARQKLRPRVGKRIDRTQLRGPRPLIRIQGWRSCGQMCQCKPAYDDCARHVACLTVCVTRGRAESGLTFRLLSCGCEIDVSGRSHRRTIVLGTACGAVSHARWEKRQGLPPPAPRPRPRRLSAHCVGAHHGRCGHSTSTLRLL